MAQLKSTNILGNLSVTGIIKGNLEGNALKDSDGNIIKDTYLKLTGGTLSNTLTIAKPSMDVEVSGYGSEALVIGTNGVSGLHLALDDNEIMAKNGPTTGSTLFLNADSANKAGGRVEIGSGGLLSKGTMTITSTSGGNTEFIFDRNTNANWKLFSSNGEFYIQCDYTSGKTSYYNVLQLGYNTKKATFYGDVQLNASLNVSANATIGATLGVGGLLTASGGILSTKQIKIFGDTANTNSIYQWEDAIYRNPDQHTPELLVRSDNSSVGIDSYRPAAVLYNHIGKEGATVGLTFAFRETETTGNSVMIASIVGYKEIAGNNNAWSSGGLRFLTKNLGTLTEAMTITSAGYVGIGTTAPGYLLHTNGRGYFSDGTVFGTEQSGKRIMYGITRNSGIKYDYAGNESLMISAGSYATASIQLFTGGQMAMTDGNGQWNADGVVPAMSLRKKGVAVNYNLTSDPAYNFYVSGTSYFNSSGSTAAVTVQGSPNPNDNIHNGVVDIVNNVSSTSANYYSTLTLMAPSTPSNKHQLIMFGRSRSSRNSGYLGFNWIGDNDARNYITLGLYGVDNIMTLTGNGNVGIGTTAPSYKFHVAGSSYFSNPITQGTISIPNGNTSIDLMNKFGSDLYVSGNGSAPNTPSIPGFYLGKSTSDENRHMDIVSGGDFSYIDFNKASIVEDYRTRFIVNVSTGYTQLTWNTAATDKTFNIQGVLRIMEKVSLNYVSSTDSLDFIFH